MTIRSPLVLDTGNLSELPPGYILGGLGTVKMLSVTLESFQYSLPLTTPNQIIDIWPSTSYRTVEYKIQLASGGAYHKLALELLHDDVNVYISEYASIYTAAPLATFDAEMHMGNIQLLITPSQLLTHVNFIRTLTIT